MAQQISSLSTNPISISSLDAVNVSEGMARSDVNNAIRGLAAMLKQDNHTVSATITAGSTTTMASISAGDYILLAPPSGSSITSFGTANAGMFKFLEPTGTILFRNSTNLVCPGGIDYSASAGDLLYIRAIDTAKWKLRAFRSDGIAAVPETFGKHLIPVYASGMQPASASGASAVVVDTATNRHNFYALRFNGSITSYAHFDLSWPKSADESTITFRVRARATSISGSAGFAFQLAAVGVGNGDAEDVAFGTGVTVTGSFSSAAALAITSESAAITVSNLAEGDLVQFQLLRAVTNAADTLINPVDVRAVDVFITTNAGTDA